MLKKDNFHRHYKIKFSFNKKTAEMDEYQRDVPQVFRTILKQICFSYNSFTLIFYKDEMTFSHDSLKGEWIVGACMHVLSLEVGQTEVDRTLINGRLIWFPEISARYTA